MIINGNECGINCKGNWVYFGYSEKGKILYIGTTMQRPSDRFRWHRHNGKDLIFKVYKNLESVDEMLDEEIRLISKHNPPLNKKTKRHNDNRRLNAKDIEKRKLNNCWCKSCLKRRVNKGYTVCYFCSITKNPA